MSSMHHPDQHPGLPIFLKNTPSMICDQVLWLVKNSNLNFQLKETPYSLNLSIKKRFTTLWNQNSVSFQDFSTESNAPIFPQQDQTSQQFQQHQSSQVELQKHIESLKAELEEALTEKDETQKDMIQLDKVHKKLQREHKEMQSKHEQLCFNFKKLKLENESSLQERNRLSVALEASKQANASKQQDVEKEINFYKAELKKLNEFKILKLEESRKVKKKEKKLRQKEKKASSLKDDEPDRDSEDYIQSYDIPTSNAFEILDLNDNHTKSADQIGVPTFLDITSCSVTSATSMSPDKQNTACSLKTTSCMNSTNSLVTITNSNPGIISNRGSALITTSCLLGFTKNTRLDPSTKSSLDPGTKCSLEPSTKSSPDPSTKGSLNPSSKSSLDPTTKGNLDFTTKSSLDPTTKSDPDNTSSSLAGTNSKNATNEVTEDYTEVFNEIRKFSMKVDAIGVKYQELHEELKRNKL